MAKKTTAILKSPNSILVYTRDWSEWLDNGDIIVASTWSVDLGLNQPYSPTFENTKTHIWLSGGVEGSSYRVTNHITTQNNLEEDAVFIFQVEEDF